MKKTLSIIFVSLFIIFLSFLYLGSLFTDRFVWERVESILPVSENHLDSTITNLEGYPFVLRRFLSSSIKERNRLPSFLRLKQIGEIKTDSKSPWIPFDANQYYNTISPGYVWDGKIRTKSFLWTRLIESFANGEANTLIKFLSSLTISETQAKELDQSALARYLTESVMFQTSLLPSEVLKWRRVDKNILEATLQFQQLSAKAKFYFNEDDEVYKVTTTDRFRASQAGYKKVPLIILYSDYRWFDNFKIPTSCILQWEEQDSIFSFEKFNVTDVEYNIKELY